MKKSIVSTYIVTSILVVSCASNKTATITNNTNKTHITNESTTSIPQQSNESSVDPFENYNRNAFRMNMKLDRTIVRPTTVWYINNVPSPARYTIANFYNNLRDFVTLGDDILQLNGMNSMQMLMRISINTTIGLFGFIDISSAIGLDEHKNTFGNTLKVYGWKNSSYFVIPLLGPSTVRDAIGLVPDIYFNPTWYVVNNDYISVGLFSISAVDSRSKYLDADSLLMTSLDPYVTIRDVYMQSIGEPIIYNNSNNNVNIDNLIDDDDNTPTAESSVAKNVESTTN